MTSYGYNALGWQTSMTDARGNVTLYQVDAAGRITKVTNADGSFRTSVYDDYGNMLSQTDEAGHSMSYSYDEFKRQVTSTDALGRTTLVDYGGGTASGGCGACNSGGKPVLTTFPNGKKVKNTYDFEWRVTATTVAYGTSEAATTSFLYDKVGNVTKVTDPLLRSTLMVYDNQNRRIKTTYPGGAFETAAYDDRDNMISSTNELGKTWTSTFGLMNEMLTQTDPTARTTSYTYAAAGAAALGRATRVTANSGRVSDAVYDALWRAVSSTVATGTAEQASSSTIFDAVGNVTSSTDELGRVTTYVYDNRNRGVSTTDAIGRVSSTSYSADSLPLVRTFPDGTTETSTYDAVHRLLTVTDALSRVTSYSYNLVDQLTTLTDARGSVTQWTYDLTGRMTAKIYANSTQELYSFDTASQLTGITRPGGQVETRVYSNRGWMTASNYSASSAPNRTYTYDSAGRQLTANITGTGLVMRTFDDAGRQLTEAQKINAAGNATFTVGYGYDVDGRRATLTYPDGKVISYTHNNRGELSTLNDGGGTPIMNYTRRLDGSLSGTMHRNGVTTAKAYDGIGRLMGTGHSAPGGLLLGGESFTLDVMSRRTSRTFANGTGDVFGYDAVGQVTAALYATTNAATQATAGGWTPAATWAYDNAGSRTTQNDNGNVTSYTANNLNQYTAINAAAPTYNANGDLLTDQTRSYLWNGRSQMTSVTTGSVTETHNYDAMSRRIARTDASGTTYFIHDGWNVIAEYKRISAANVLQRRYVWGQDLSGSLQGAGGVGGLVMAEEISGATTTPYYYHYDGNGNVLEITNSSGTVATSYRYDAYGKTLSATGTYAAANRYRFSTKPVELASGLYFYGYRFYDPANGRWTSRDPIGEEDSINLFQFVRNCPQTRIDVLGLDEIDKLGHEGVQDAIRKSNKAGGKVEYCGAICCKKDKRVYRTIAVFRPSPGNPSGCVTPTCPDGDKEVGRFHSHVSDPHFSYDDYGGLPPRGRNYMGVREGEDVNVVGKSVDDKGRPSPTVDGVKPDGSLTSPTSGLRSQNRNEDMNSFINAPRSGR